MQEKKKKHRDKRIILVSIIIIYPDARINYFSSSQIDITSQSDVRWIRVACQMKENIFPTNDIALNPSELFLYCGIDSIVG